MTAPSPASRRVRSPRWLDARLVVGVLLVLGSVLVGAKVISSADQTARFWVAGHDLSPGLVLQANDVRSVSVRLSSGSAQYFPVSTDLVGTAMTRSVSAGELLPRSAVGPVEAATTVTIPFGADNAPKISAGQRITVWVSTKLCPSAVVLADVTVQSVQSTRGGSFSTSGGTGVVVRVSPVLAQRVIEALALSGAVLRAGVLDGGAGSGGALPELARCVAGGS